MAENTDYNWTEIVPHGGPGNYVSQHESLVSDIRATIQALEASVDSHIADRAIHAGLPNYTRDGSVPYNTTYWNPDDEAVKYRDDDGVVHVIQGTAITTDVEGLTNPLVRGFDANGYDLQNVGLGAFERLNADNVTVEDGITTLWYDRESIHGSRSDGEVFRVVGDTADWILTSENGTGRISQVYNAYREGDHWYYQIDGEPATRQVRNPPEGSGMVFQTADESDADSVVTWTSATIDDGSIDEADHAADSDTLGGVGRGGFSQWNTGVIDATRQTDRPTTAIGGIGLPSGGGPNWSVMFDIAVQSNQQHAYSRVLATKANGPGEVRVSQLESSTTNDNALAIPEVRWYGSNDQLRVLHHQANAYDGGADYHARWHHMGDGSP